MRFDIPALREQAKTLLRQQEPQAKKIARIYALVWAAVTVLSNVLTYVLMARLDTMTGLSQVSAREKTMVLSIMVPLVANLGLMLWGAGYSGAALSLCRGESPDWKRMGWSFNQPLRFLLCGLQFLGVWLVSCYLLTAVVLFVLPGNLLLDGQSLNMTLIYGLSALMALVAGWMLLNRRLLYFFVADHGDIPAMHLTRMAKMLLSGYRWQFFRIDLRWWWYYVLTFLVALLPYGTLFLPETCAGYQSTIDLVAFAVEILATVVLTLCFRNRLYVTYAMAYDLVYGIKTGKVKIEATGENN